MRPVLSRAEMRAFDAFVIATCGVPGVVLMENAGRGAADVIVRETCGGDARSKRIVIVCGAGNNGGDGFVVARHLHARAARVVVLSTVDPTTLQGDARVNHDAWVGVGGTVQLFAREEAWSALATEIARADAVVDALFGTGLSRPVTGESARAIEAMNAATCARVAIDVPSGIDADTGATLGVSFTADHTVTFAHAKLGLLTPRGARAAGRLHVVDLGVPGALGPALKPSAELLERRDVVRLLAPRAIDAHKNTAGHVGVFAGSSGKVGAALMVARAALRAGAGVATIATWEDAAAIARARVLEEMVTTIASGAARDASIDAALHGKRAVVVGPGFGTGDESRAAVYAIAARFDGPAIYDADALTLFADAVDRLRACKTPPVLTPHPGEAARLLGATSDAIEKDRYGSARAIASKARAVVVLKGACTLIADPSGRVVVHEGGTPALATAGSGDTLSGIVGAFLCSLAPFDAACAAVFVHAAVATEWSVAHGDRGLLASEIAEGVPSVLAAFTRDHAARRF